MPDNHEDHRSYVTEGSVDVAGERFEAGRIMVFRPRDPLTVKAGPSGARLMLPGGATLNQDLYIRCNFVSSSKEKIEAATREWKTADWANGAFQLLPGDVQEFVPISAALKRTRPRKACWTQDCATSFSPGACLNAPKR